MQSAPIPFPTSLRVDSGNSLDAAVREHLEHLLHSRQFQASGRSREFLRFVVNEALQGRGQNLNQGSVATAVFGRKGDFDPVLDPIVRVQAGRLRRSLERYYQQNGEEDRVRIELPKGQYVPDFVRVTDLNRKIPTAAGAASRTRRDWPAVVIYGFDTASAEESVTAERISEELALELGRYGDIRILLQSDLERLYLLNPTCARFELRGRYVRQADHAFVSARLVDRTTGEHVWSDEFRATAAAEAEQRFASVSEITRVIAARLGAEDGIIVRKLIQEQCARTPGSNDPIDAALRCYRFFVSGAPRDISATLEAAYVLTARDPENPSAWAHATRLQLMNTSFELAEPLLPIDAVVAHAYRGVLLDPGHARPRCLLASALLVKGDVRAARKELDMALHLNGDSLAHREAIGWLLALSGDWALGIEVIRDAMRRNPFCLRHVYQALWADHMRRSEYEAALAAAEEYRDSSFFWRELMIASCLGHLGRRDEAYLRIGELLRAKPTLVRRGRTLIGNYIKSTNLLEKIVDGLLKSGLLLN